MSDDALQGQLPAGLEAALYTACLESQSPTVDLERLCAAHPAHAPALRQLAGEVFGAQRTLHTTTVPSPDGLLPGTQLGPFTIEHEIGRGAFGRVYKALQSAPVRRHVAVKVLSAAGAAAEVLRRFDAERQVLAQLDHPGIAHIYDAGTTPGGQPFFAMEYIGGGTLIRHADERRLPIRDRIHLFLDLCTAIERAHQRGVVHRDLKPGNLLVVAEADRARVKVIDFGLAKVLQPERVMAEPSTTELGRLLGTPEYMSPEQANGQPIDTRADVWSLGVVLFELLAGSLPFPSPELRAEGFASVVRILNDRTPPAASSVVSPAAAAARGSESAELRRALRGDLDLIIATCLQKERDQRYDSAAALAADLRRFLRHEPLAVQPPRLGYVLRKLARRHRAACAAFASIVVAVLVSTVVLAWSAVRVADERDQAEAARETAEANAYAATLAAAQAAADAGRSGALRTLLATTDPKRRRVEHALLAVQADGALQQITTGVTVFNGSLCIGDTVWVFDRMAEREDLHVFDLVTGGHRQLPTTDAPSASEIVAVALAPDARSVACSYGDGRLLLRDAATGEVRRTLQAAAPLGWGLVYAPAGEVVFATGSSGVMRFDLVTGAVTRFAAEHSWGIDISHDGRLVAIGTVDGQVHLRDLLSGELRASLPHGDVVNAVRFLPGDRRLLSAGRGTLRLWDLDNGRGIATQETGSLTIHAVALARSALAAVTTNSDGRLQMWSTDDLRPLGVFCGHAGLSRSVHELADGRWLSASWDGSLRIWPPLPAAVGTPLEGASGNPLELALHPTRPLLFVATEQELCAFDCERRTLLWSVPLAHRAGGMVVTSDGRTVFVGVLGDLLAFDTRDGTKRSQATIAAGQHLRRLATNDGGQQLVAATHTGELVVVDGGTLEPGRRVPGGEDSGEREPNSLWVHASGSLVSLCTRLGIRTVDLTAGATVWSRSGPYTSVVADAAPDRLLFAKGSDTIELVAAATGAVLHTYRLAERGNLMLSRLYAGGGDRLLVADGELRVLARSDCRELLALRGRGFAIAGIAYDPARNLLVTAGGAFGAPAEILLWPHAGAGH
ncbi:MAG: protein kinase [Planctomycetes bacterium]|jgi:serine/threonine protein kinase/streptogramin lyase|nr:protein kinase [Planctomycetota bacterium]